MNGPVWVDDAVIALNDKHGALIDDDRFDVRDAQAKILGDTHAECLVLDRICKALDLGLEDVGGWCPLDRPTPRTVRHAREQELLLDTGKR